MPLQGGLSIERMCELAPVSRAGFYRWFQEPQPVEEEMEVRSAIQQIALEHRRRYDTGAFLRSCDGEGWS
jgi:putative transposase